MSRFTLDAAARDALFLAARSTLNFSDEPVSMDTVRDVWDLIKWGPTAFNTVPLRLAAITSQEGRARVTQHAAAGNQAKVESAPLVLVAARDDRFHDHHALTGGSPDLAAKLEANPESRIRTAHTNAMLQIGYLIVGLRGAGLAVRPVGGFDRDALDADLFDDSTWRSELILLVGHPADDHGAGDRKGRITTDIAIKEF
ncbi:malonic semialdehyde reductase [Demequina sp. B12]|uniref:malonic semialdehyde reductase n=1 Tax=Demequina sp. B12 TaxID=2992757 RepID=UPI00237A2929|nr:malonic semialdehyde reductase [Demequina sp. B12]MDE0572480.1 malonic semialdehyde reductase [Demequina sp. B12]